MLSFFVSLIGKRETFRASADLSQPCKKVICFLAKCGWLTFFSCYLFLRHSFFFFASQAAAIQSAAALIQPASQLSAAKLQDHESAVVFDRFMQFLLLFRPLKGKEKKKTFFTCVITSRLWMAQRCTMNVTRPNIWQSQSATSFTYTEEMSIDDFRDFVIVLSRVGNE